MKSIKNILFSILGVIGFAYFISSCNDKFSEKDLLELQVQLGTTEDSLKAVQQLAALNAAGELVSFQVKVVDTDGAAVAGLDVTMGAAGADGTPDNQTLVTDATGSVIYNRVVIGGNTMTIAGADIFDATLTMNFGNIQEGVHYEIIDGQIIPIRVTENAVISVLSTTGTPTATVSGVASIETDVTNRTSEIPQNVTIVADFDDSMVLSSSITMNYFFPVNDNVLNLGSGVVDNTTGAYTMTVPAGVRFDVIIPDIQEAQRVAANVVGGVDLPRPEYQSILTNFGPSHTADNIPSVPGAFAIFEQPPAAGRGFTFGTFAQQARGIPTFTQLRTQPWTAPYLSATNLITQVTNLGAGYQFSPTMTITGGTGATGEVRLDYLVSSVTVNTIATGYPFTSVIPVNIRYFDNQMVPVSQFSVALNVTTSATGEITQTEVDAAIAAANTANDLGFGTNRQAIPSASTGMEVTFPAPGVGGAATVVINSRVERVLLTDGGSGFTAPVFTFTGGGGTTQFAMSVLEMGTQWTFNVDNMGVTTPYGFLPDQLTFEHETVTTGSAGVATSTQGQNVSSGNNASLISLLAPDASGNIMFVDLTATYRTNLFSSVAPRVLVDETESFPAARYIRPFEINLDGQVTGMSTGGHGSAFTSSNGSGYPTQFTVTVEPSATGAPGAGAIISITGGTNNATGEYQWAGGFDVLNGGSGYMQDLNAINNSINSNTRVFYNAGGDVTDITLTTGNTKVLNIIFGTGDKTININ